MKFLNTLERHFRAIAGIPPPVGPAPLQPLVDTLPSMMTADHPGRPLPGHTGILGTGFCLMVFIIFLRHGMRPLLGHWCVGVSTSYWGPGRRGEVEVVFVPFGS